MSIVDEAVEDGVGIGRVTEHLTSAIRRIQRRPIVLALNW
jgi:hypothetical protein